MKDSVTATVPRTIILFLLGVLACMLLRSIWTYPVDALDATAKYDMASKLARSGNLALLLQNQHTARWSETLPQTALTLVTRPHFFALQLLPLAAFATYFCLLLLVMRRHLNLALLGLFAVLLFVQPQMLRATNSLLNPAFGVMYVTLGAWLLTRKPGAEPAPWASLLAALMFVCAYAAHITYLGFAGGAAVYLLYRYRRPGPALLFSFGIVLFIFCETLVFNRLADGALTLGRLEFVFDRPQTQARLGHGGGHTLLDLLSRWVRLPWLELLFVAGYCATSLALLFNRRWREVTPDFVTCCMLSAGLFALGLTFLVLDFTYLTPAMPLNPRYVNVFMPFAILGSIWGLAMLAGTRPRQKLYPLHALSLGLLAVFVALPDVLGSSRQFSSVTIRPEAFIWRSEQAYTQFAQRVKSGQLVIEGNKLNRDALAALVNYPGHAGLMRKQGQVFAPSRHPDALCVDHLVNATLPESYHPCPTAGDRR